MMASVFVSLPRFRPWYLLPPSLSTAQPIRRKHVCSSCEYHDKQGPFQVFDSVLSEEAVLAFEYGYATAEPSGLTFGKHNLVISQRCAVIDQFISSGEQKWARLCGLTMLLPHGYEGQGPESTLLRVLSVTFNCVQNKHAGCCSFNTEAQVYHT
ncbi:hypothetical protein OH492_06185 [Vibrio chagasii]|nr:hypothetical protein [Vibrio chagasii]